MMASAARYRFKDSLDNFIIRVHLRKVTRREESAGMEEEVREFHWQEKMFSVREEEMYATLRPFAPERERRYNEALTGHLRSNNGSRPNRRLFTYIEGDHECMEVGSFHSITTTSHETVTVPVQLASVVRKRYRSTKSSQHPIVDRPSMDLRTNNRLVTPPSRMMLVMADLGNLQDHHDEHILCTIMVDRDGVISLSPTLSGGVEWTKVESSQNEMFEYKFEHASPGITSIDKEKEKKIVRELHKQRTEEILTSVGGNFVDPPPRSVRVMVFGELESARDFEYDDLFITTSMRLPQGWACTNHSEDELTFVSQICRARSSHMTNIAHFSLPFEYHLLFDGESEEDGDNDGDNDEHPRLLSTPVFHFEVASIDTWDRHRTEGYGHWSLPSQPGSYCPSILMWRPMGNTLLDELRRFFVGGGPQLEDIVYSGVPADVKGPILAKYGMKTKSTGSVQLRVHIVHQSRELLESNLKTLSTTQSLFLLSTEATLEHYRRTKLKMAATLKTTQPLDSTEK